MITSLCKRWYAKTSSFHLLVGEMTVTVNNVVCLLHIPIDGRMSFLDKMVRRLGVSEAPTIKECKDKFGAHITYTWLNELYEEHLTVGTRQAHARTREELGERETHRQ